MVSSIPTEYKQLLNIKGTQKGTTSPGQSGPGSNGNEWIVHTFQIFRTRTSPCSLVDTYTFLGSVCVGGLTPLLVIQSMYILSPADRALKY